MSRVMLEVNELTTKYITRFRENVYAVDHVSLKVEEGRSVGIAGESGCGKSTLALSLMGYYFAPLHYSGGEIIVDGKNISGMDRDDVRRTILGNEISYIPQAAMNALNPTQKVIHLIEDVIQAHHPGTSKKEIYELARERFELLGLPAEVLQKYSVELSGGMKQRTVIATSVILSPRTSPASGCRPHARSRRRRTRTRARPSNGRFARDPPFCPLRGHRCRSGSRIGKLDVKFRIDR